MSGEQVNARDSQFAFHENQQLQGSSISDSYTKQLQKTLQTSTDSLGKFNESLAKDKLTILKGAYQEPSFTALIDKIIQNLHLFDSGKIHNHESFQAILKEMYNSSGHSHTDDRVTVQISSHATSNIQQPHIAVQKSAKADTQSGLNNKDKKRNKAETSFFSNIIKQLFNF